MLSTVSELLFRASKPFDFRVMSPVVLLWSWFCCILKIITSFLLCVDSILNFSLLQSLIIPRFFFVCCCVCIFMPPLSTCYSIHNPWPSSHLRCLFPVWCISFQSIFLRHPWVYTSNKIIPYDCNLEPHSFPCQMCVLIMLMVALVNCNSINPPFWTFRLFSLFHFCRCYIDDYCSSCIFRLIHDFFLRINSYIKLLGQRKF